MTQTQLQCRHDLHEETNKFLFMQCSNDIQRAINSAREAAEIKPSERNIMIREELEAFYMKNEEFYSEAKEYFEENINK